VGNHQIRHGEAEENDVGLKCRWEGREECQSMSSWMAPQECSIACCSAVERRKKSIAYI